MESLHGVLEWFIILAIVSAGFAVDRKAPYKRVRYPSYVVVLLAAFIFDLNKVSFRVDAVNAALYLLVLVIIVELVLICVRKKSAFLLCGALALFVPVFLYVYAALLLIVPLPCHDKSVYVVDRYTDCGGKRYALSKRPSFDPFKKSRVYSLTREINRTPLKKQVDKYSTPKGYAEADFAPRWECLGNGRVKADLTVDGYAVWSLLDKSGEE